jgi:Sap, sulfolipid-1-addressing protein
LQLLLLALDAALYPTLLAAVVILLAQERPRRLLGAYLAGGLLISIGLGLGIVFLLSGSSALKHGQSSGVSWQLDLAIGGLAVLGAVTLATRADQRLRERRRARKGTKGKADDKDKEPWSHRLLSRGSAPLVFGAAMAINLPGAAYLVALKDIAAGNHSTAGEILLVVGFNLIMFLLAEVPLLGLLLAPDRTDALVARMNAWITRNGRLIAIVLCVVLGVFLIVRGLVNS